MIITIDGPTASGKTTVARMLAGKLHFYYISSGLLFRGLAYVLVHEYKYGRTQLENPQLADIQRALDPQRFVYQYNAATHEQLFFDNNNITSFLRDSAISTYASLLGTQDSVRTALEKLQHRIADHHNVVAEGRDTGSVIFPHAQIKFYLTASLEVRVARWAKDQQAKGRVITLEQAQAEVQERDERDASRALAPLCIPARAIIIDDSALAQQQVMELMELEIIKHTPFGSMEA
jgi:CMP/dCMP kinase